MQETGRRRAQPCRCAGDRRELTDGVATARPTGGRRALRGFDRVWSMRPTCTDDSGRPTPPSPTTTARWAWSATTSSGATWPVRPEAPTPRPIPEELMLPCHELRTSSPSTAPRRRSSITSPTAPTTRRTATPSRLRGHRRPWPSTGVFELTQTDAATTTVRFTFELTPRGLMKLMSPMIAAHEARGRRPPQRQNDRRATTYPITGTQRWPHARKPSLPVGTAHAR